VSNSVVVYALGEYLAGDINDLSLTEAERNYCPKFQSIQFLIQCLRIKRIGHEQAVSWSEYHFIVEFLNQDDSLFVRGPCCDRNATDFPPESQLSAIVPENLWS